MKAIVSAKYGSPDVLHLAEVKKPIPAEDEVLIRVHAATVTAGDCETRGFKFSLLLWIPLRIVLGILKPRNPILGQEFAGEVESVGDKVDKFEKGDQVYAPTLINFGAYAEYICMPVSCAMSGKPVNMSFEEAATVPTGGLNALHILRKGNVQRGEKILINGAGGSIGTYCVQIAKYFGAEVTAVDSAAKLDMLRTIGADFVIDYTQEDFTKRNNSYDLIVDVIGSSSFSRSIRRLNENGRYLLASPTLLKMIRGLFVSKKDKKKVMSAIANYQSEDLAFLRDLIERGLVKSVVDRSYPLEKTVEAHKYVETGNKKGNVVIRVAS